MSGRGKAQLVEGHGRKHQLHQEATKEPGGIPARLMRRSAAAACPVSPRPGPPGRRVCREISGALSGPAILLVLLEHVGTVRELPPRTPRPRALSVSRPAATPAWASVGGGSGWVTVAAGRGASTDIVVPGEIAAPVAEAPGSTAFRSFGCATSPLHWPRWRQTRQYSDAGEARVASSSGTVCPPSDPVLAGGWVGSVSDSFPLPLRKLLRRS